MIDVLLFDTEKLNDLYNNIGNELKRRKDEQNIYLSLCWLPNNLLIKGPNIESKSDEIKVILQTFGKCNYEHTSLPNKITFCFENYKDIMDVVNNEEHITNLIKDLFVINNTISNSSLESPLLFNRLSLLQLKITKIIWICYSLENYIVCQNVMELVVC